MTRRTERIGEQIRGELARLLHAEVTDPRIPLLTVVRVDVSPDLRNAIVFWSPLTTEEPEALSEEALVAAEDGLASAASFLRRRLAESLPQRRVPALQFRHDASLAAGSRTLHLLQELSDGSKG